MTQADANRLPVIAGRYVLRSVIGKGGMATVYRAYDRNLGRTVAIKLMQPAGGSGAEPFAQAITEARNTAALKGPHTVDVYDCFMVGTNCAIVMELVEGINLRDALKRFGRMSPTGAARVASHACLSLGEAHGRGIIHRDVKPANIMFVRSGDIKVADFGIAQSVYGRFVRQRHVIGTIQYMSPEQMQGLPPTVTDDIYALGATIYELCCGHRPYESLSFEELMKANPRPTPVAPSRWNPLVDDHLEAIIMRCLSQIPSQRYQSAGQLRLELEDYLTSRNSVADDVNDPLFPRKPRYWALAFPRTGEGPANYIQVDRPMVVGRGRDADVVLPSRTLSEHHARVIPTGALLRVDDLGTSGRTRVNGEPVGRFAYCMPGDILEFGVTKLTVGCSRT